MGLIFAKHLNLNALIKKLQHMGAKQASIDREHTCVMSLVWGLLRLAPIISIYAVF